MLERYFSMAALPKQSKLHLFRGIVVTRSGEHLRSQGSLSYTWLRELFLSKLSQLGFDPKQFGLHSLRSGGASAAANAGVPERLFKCHGRWRSESVKDGCVKDLVSAPMSVSELVTLCVYPFFVTILEDIMTFGLACTVSALSHWCFFKHSMIS